MENISKIKGSFVAAPNREFLREQKLKEAEGYLEKAADAARTGGISAGELLEMLNLLLEE